MTQLPFGQIAPISRRAVAYLIDALIAGGLAIVLSVVLGVATALSGGLEASLMTVTIGGPLVSLVLLGWFVVYTNMQAGAGSIGMRAQGVRLVSETDGSPIGFGRALLRNIIFGLSAGIVVGYFTPLFDGSGRFQGWHDKVGRSLMLDARAPGGITPITAPATTAVPTVSAPTGAFPAYPAPVAPSQPPAIPGLPHPGSYGAPAPQAPAHTPVSPYAPPVAPGQTPSAPPAAAVPQAPPVPTGAYSPSAPVFPAPATPAAPAAPIGEGGDLIAFVPGVTQDAPPQPPQTAAPAPAAAEPTAEAPAAPEPVAPTAAPAAPSAVPVASAPAPAPAPVEDPDVESTRISIPGHRLIFTWDDGTRVSVSRRTIFGRNPAAEEGAATVAVRDETLSLSRTHFEAAAETSGGWVLDRHSTNGTTIVREGQRIACPPGQRVPVRLGDAIEIGDRIVTVGGYA
ncbi:RDD family protein [Microbacterium sp. NPDC008134]|uniref:RDD family protein n=1 Tax=Microbacterium sp. NPDC008134 TaxID=3364183 RepID=UPI0036EDF283